MIVKLSIGEQITAFSNLVATRSFWIIVWLFFFSNLYFTREFLSSAEPVVFAYVLYIATTRAKLGVLEVIKFHKIIFGLPRGMIAKDLREVDVRVVLDDLHVPYHDIIAAGFHAGQQKGFAAYKDMAKAMAALADRNTFFVSHAAHPYTRIRLFEAIQPMTSSMAYYGFLRPTIVLFRDKLDNLSSFQRFELLHELGHCTHKGQYKFGMFWLYLQALLLTGVIVLSLTERQDLIHFMPMLIAYSSFVLWTRTTVAEDESRADSFALQNMGLHEHQLLRSWTKKFKIPDDSALSERENTRRRARLVQMIDRFRRTVRGAHLFDVDYDADQTGLPSTAVEMAKYGGLVYKFLSIARLLSLIYACQFVGSSFDRAYWTLIPATIIFILLLFLIEKYQDQVLSSRLGVNSLRDQSHLYFASGYKRGTGR